MNKPKTGFAIHCHHNVLVEYCYDYNERVNAIKRNKPLSEQEIRLKLFKLLPQEEALQEIPKDWQKAYQDLQKAYQDWQKAYQDLQKAYQDLQKADQDWQKAYQDWQKVYQDWPQTAQDAFHKKWCGCSEWNGKEIVFK